MSLYGDFSQSRFDAAPCAALTSQGVCRGVGNFETTNTALFYLFCRSAFVRAACFASLCDRVHVKYVMVY